jgi:hypothetical protein
MRNLLLLALFIGSFSLLAADEPDWHEGMIVLKDGQVQRGKLAIHSFELALFKTESGLEVYTPLKVKSIFYFDPHYNFYRKFVSVDVRWGRPAAFYEVVVNGKLSVVRKLKSPFVSCDERSDKLDYKYFVKQGSQLLSLKDFKSLYRRIKSTNPALAEEIKLKKLNPAFEADAIRIVQLINDQDGVIAANF